LSPPSALCVTTSAQTLLATAMEVINNSNNNDNNNSNNKSSRNLGGRISFCYAAAVWYYACTYNCAKRIYT
jgi:hypothetical protein